MWKIAQIKQDTRHNLKLNYWACIAVCFLMVIFAAEYSLSDGFLAQKDDVGLESGAAANTTQEYKANVKGSQTASGVIGKVTGNIKDENVKKATSGVMAAFANAISKTADTLSFVADAVMKVVGKSKVAYFLLSLLGAALSLAIYMFFKAQIIVGERRFFLENRIYHNTKATRIFHTYHTTNVGNVAVVMFCKQFLWFLWCLTIVGGVIKLYEYRAIPYILAENPEIKRKECFALSKQMAYGHKMEMFKFDMSYILWFFLGIATLGFTAVFYSNAYYRGAQSEIHAILRENAKAENFQYSELLNDADLFRHSEDVLSADVYPTVKLKTKHSLSIPWDRKYTLIHIGLIFFAFAMIGWCWEVFYHFLKDGILVNRGSLWGPWLPIYGIGGACVVLFLKPLGKKPVVLAACTFVACGIIEYVTAWYFETFKHIKYWDYSHFLFNLDGRICLEGLIMFTVLASLGLYVIAPRLDEFFKKWPNSVKVPLLCILCAGFISDIVFTQFHPHTGKGISSSYYDPFNNRLM